ncbi:MAG: alpha/beta fold hydrolase [Nitrospiraceae bacterium]|nr:alpha/beta fold hydrolase [Nitrospiraceae bacterium]
MRFEQDLLRALKQKNIKNISMFGWSLGGFVAADFSSKHTDIVNRLVLVAIRKKYKPAEIEFARQQLIIDKNRYLNRFYIQCFPKRRDMDWFKKHLLKNYCNKFDLDYLVQTLGYLGHTKIKTHMLRNINRIKIIHGRLDRIAPIQEAVEIKNGLKHAELLVIEDAGHAPFLKKDCNKI